MSFVQIDGVVCAHTPCNSAPSGGKQLQGHCPLLCGFETLSHRPALVLPSFSAYFSPKWFQWQASLTSCCHHVLCLSFLSPWITDSGVRKAGGTRRCSASSWLLWGRAWKRCDLLCIAGAGNLRHLETGHFSSNSIRNIKAGLANQSDGIPAGLLGEQSLFWFVMEGLSLGGVTAALRLSGCNLRCCGEGRIRGAMVTQHWGVYTHIRSAFWQKNEKPSRNSCLKEWITVSSAKELTALEFHGINGCIRTSLFISAFTTTDTTLNT